jgi:hypothetical protein
VLVTSDSPVLGAVSTQYDDYVGTAAADDADAWLGARSLYQIAGLDRDRWLIVSIELARSKASERVSVYAIDRELHPVRSLAELEERPDLTSGIPVVAFDLPGLVGVDTFVAEAFQRFSVRLSSRAITGQSLNVTARQPLEDVDPSH